MLNQCGSTLISQSKDAKVTVSPKRTRKGAARLRMRRVADTPEALLETEGVHVNFEIAAIEKIAEIAEEVNTTTENIGARRLHTLMECLLEDVIFDAPDMQGRHINIDEQYVLDKLKDIKEDEDLSRYIL